MRERGDESAGERREVYMATVVLVNTSWLACKNMQCKERGMVEGRDIAVLMSSLKA